MSCTVPCGESSTGGGNSQVLSGKREHSVGYLDCSKMADWQKAKFCRNFWDHRITKGPGYTGLFVLKISQNAFLASELLVAYGIVTV